MTQVLYMNVRAYGLKWKWIEGMEWSESQRDTRVQVRLVVRVSERSRGDIQFVCVCVCVGAKMEVTVCSLAIIFVYELWIGGTSANNTWRQNGRQDTHTHYSLFCFWRASSFEPLEVTCHQVTERKRHTHTNAYTHTHDIRLCYLTFIHSLLHL